MLINIHLTFELLNYFHSSSPVILFWLIGSLNGSNANIDSLGGVMVAER